VYLHEGNSLITEISKRLSHHSGRKANRNDDVNRLLKTVITYICSFRVYREKSNTIVCHYEQSSVTNSTINQHISVLTSKTKRIYQLIIVIFRVAVPFVLLLTANIILFVSVRTTRRQSSKSKSTLLIRHGHHRQVTPMIFFSSCILLLTISPR
jgi:hypothetical protein